MIFVGDYEVALCLGVLVVVFGGYFLGLGGLELLKFDQKLLFLFGQAGHLRRHSS